MTIHSIVIQKLLSTNAQLGRRVAAHHFKVYTYGFRNGMAIIDSDKTLICLRSACQFIGSLVRQKARFMFVNTNPLFDEIVEHMTKKIGCYSPSAGILWRMGGSLTNSNSPKKFRSRNKKLCFAPPQPPDCLVVLDTGRKSSMILEAERLQIPIVGLVDSSMPWDCFQRITYPVPANDSVQFVYLFCNMITKTFLFEQKKLKEEYSTSAAIAHITNEDKDREKGKGIDQSKGKTVANAEVVVIPYESLTSMPEDDVETKKLLDKFVVVKFNGALGTEMGFSSPKSAMEVCNGLTLLDLIVNQIESLNSKYGCNIPLLLMNTIKTHDDTLKVLEKYSKPGIDIHTISQSQDHQVKSFDRQSGDKELYHSDPDVAFLSLMNGGTLDVLLSQGKEYILVVNSDNSRALIDPKILNHLIQNKIECCLEVTSTTSNELISTVVNLLRGKFQLEEIARNPSRHSVEKFKLIDTRNLWLNLKAIKRLADTDAMKMENYPTSKEVGSDKILLQETAAVSLVRFFDQVIGINVPQSRFLPVNATSDLLLLQSDLFTSDGGILVRNTARNNPANPCIDFGPEFQKISDLRSRFKSIPSIIDLDSLKVSGDVWFGAGITLKGRVSVVAKPGMKLEIPDGVVLENKEINDPKDI